jgi:hypothetical protein
MLAQVVPQRSLLLDIANATPESIELRLQEEERRERDADRVYWSPLLKELEQIRHRKQ